MRPRLGSSRRCCHLAVPPRPASPAPHISRGPAARRPLSPCPAMPADLSGTWNLLSSDNFEGYMLALGRAGGSAPPTGSPGVGAEAAGLGLAVRFPGRPSSRTWYPRTPIPLFRPPPSPGLPSRVSPSSIPPVHHLSSTPFPSLPVLCPTPNYPVSSPTPCPYISPSSSPFPCTPSTIPPLVHPPSPRPSSAPPPFPRTSFPPRRRSLSLCPRRSLPAPWPILRPPLRRTWGSEGRPAGEGTSWSLCGEALDFSQVLGLC